MIFAVGKYYFLGVIDVECERYKDHYPVWFERNPERVYGVEFKGEITEESLELLLGGEQDKDDPFYDGPECYKYIVRYKLVQVDEDDIRNSVVVVTGIEKRESWE